MSKELERQMVNAILNKIRTSRNNVFRIAKGRVKNQETLKELEYTESNVKQVIFELDADDCINSFKKDKEGFEGYVFEFGKEIEKREIYIKFRVLFEKDICRLNCISFHFANYKIKYLFK